MLISTYWPIYWPLSTYWPIDLLTSTYWRLPLVDLIWTFLTYFFLLLNLCCDLILTSCQFYGDLLSTLCWPLLSLSDLFLSLADLLLTISSYFDGYFNLFKLLLTFFSWPLPSLCWSNIKRPKPVPFRGAGSRLFF